MNPGKTCHREAEAVAIQFNQPGKFMDCRVAALLAMTAWVTLSCVGWAE
ncbi:MAG TPA: hypothetical protein VN283_07050 [Thiobacillus sp.]|nr:hypothetical protein [Thiobacillus sp.]